MLFSLRRSLVILAASIAPAVAQQAPAPAPAAEVKPVLEFKATPARLNLKDGDSWVFLGDSITHQCLYTQYVEDYVYTRYPKRHIHFHNAGVGGDRASDALTRFEEDVAAFKPNYVTILLGMNDGGYTKYDQAIFDRYQEGMTTILDQLASSGAAAIPMTPTMYDSRADKLRGKGDNPVKLTYYNGVLSLFGSWLREQASDRGLQFVDMWSPLNNLTLEARRQDPKFTVIADAVHPGAPGQVIMATAVIDHLLPRVPVSQIVVGEEKGQPSIKGTRGIAANLKRTDTIVTFDFTAESLPWVLPPEAEQGYALTKAGHRYSNEKLTARHLKPGNYDLKIDGTTIATVSAAQLAAGLELQANDKTPQYQQALKVALLNKQRNDEAIRPLRNTWGQMKGERRKVSQAVAANAANLDQVKKDFETWTATFRPRIQELIAKAKGFEDQIYQANQPIMRHYEVVASAQ